MSDRKNFSIDSPSICSIFFPNLMYISFMGSLKECITEEVRYLAQGPNKINKRYKGYIVNGF